MSRVPASDNAGRRRDGPTPTQRALGLLTRREHSRKELTRKLAVRGVEKDEAVAAIDKLAQAGWQDDTRFAASLARTRAATGFGPARIRAELGMHGLGAEQVAAALAACETDWAQAARELIARRFASLSPKDPKQRRKAIEFLLRRGFDHACAFGAVGGRGVASEEDDPDQD
ncbi:MAG TPA: regulatory protein RecX [Xanthomonadaceae bacterium]|jgi:regulatory protein